MRVGERQRRIGLELAVGGQGEAADALAQARQAPRDVGAQRQDRAPAGHGVDQHRQGAVPAAVDHGPAAPSPAAPDAEAAVKRRIDLGQRMPQVAVGAGGAEKLDRDRRAGLGVAQHQPGLDRPVPCVALQPEGRVQRLRRRRRRRGRRIRRPPHGRARPPRSPRSGRGGPPPSAARRQSGCRARAGAATGCPCRTARAPRAPRPGRGRARGPETTASTRSTGSSMSGVSTASACVSNAARKASSCATPMVRPAAARWPP